MTSAHQYEVGQFVEVDGKIEEGCTGGWFPAQVLEVGPKDQVKVQYLHVKDNDGKLEEQSIKKTYLRPKPLTQPYTDWSHIDVGLIVDHLVENLWWLAIVLWVKRNKKGDVTEVGCVYPRTAGEAPNVASEPKLLRPAIDWSVKAGEWRPVLSAYKKHAFQDELDAQAKKRNLPSADVHEDSKYIDPIAEIRRKPKAADAKEGKGGRGQADAAEGADAKESKRGSTSRRSAPAEASGKAEKEEKSKRQSRASQGAASDAAEQPPRKSRRIDSSAAGDGVHAGQAAGEQSGKDAADKRDVKREKANAASSKQAAPQEPQQVPVVVDEEVEVHVPAAAMKLENMAVSATTHASGWTWPTPNHRFHLRSDQPPFAVFHDARAYFIVMVLPAVEPGNCWTQVTETGLVEIAWSMWGQESHWAEMNTLKLRHKSRLVSFIDDLLQPEETLDLMVGAQASQAPPEEKANLFAHSTCIQLPVELYGHVHTTGPPQGAGRTPRASLRLGMYKIKIYKRPADAGPEQPAVSQSDRAHD